MLGFALAGAIAMTAVVIADVDFNPATGVGFSGKGDVQSAFGWNNAEAQANIPYVSFSAQASQTRKQACYTNPDQVFTGYYRYSTRTASQDVAWEARLNKQGDITGIYLNGYSSEIVWSDWSDWVRDPTLGPGDVGGDRCPNGTHPKFGPIEGEISASALYVTFLDESVQIWPED
jgi:hypothetical protein